MRVGPPADDYSRERRREELAWTESHTGEAKRRVKVGPPADNHQTEDETKSLLASIASPSPGDASSVLQTPITITCHATRPVGLECRAGVIRFFMRP